jgi:hypothetical protein
MNGNLLRRLRPPVGIVLWGALSICLTAPSLTAQQRIDEAYTAKILEFTTEDFFLTPYVDHLPASDTVPTPLDYLGHIVGAADVLSYSHEVHGYMRAVAAASPRVEVFSIGQSEEGREMILVAVSDEATISNLDHYRDLTGRLADPRQITDEEAARIIGEAKPFYWATGGLHSTETGSPEMLMELVYRLAVEESDFIREIRDNAIVLVTPVLEPDGRDKVVDVYMAPRIDPDASVASSAIYWGAYVSHDNNRDYLGMSLALSKNVIRAFLDFHPQVLHDLHESASYLYASTGTGPYNAWVDPILVDEWFELSFSEVSELTRKGVPGVWTWGFFDGWSPNYLFTAANAHNAIGRFYETQGGGNGSTRMVTANDARSWYKPNPPLSRVLWSLRNNTNLMQSGLLVAMHHVAVNHRKFMENFWLKGKRSIAKAHNEGPAAYILPADDARPGLQADLLNLLILQGVEISQAEDDFELDGETYPEGSYIVRMDQPYSRMADMLLDRQYFNVDDARPYDDVGWMLGPLYNLETVRTDDPAVLDVTMRRIDGAVMLSGGVDALSRRRPAAFLVDHTADNKLATFCFNAGDLTFEAAEEAFTVEERHFNPGTLIFKVDGNPTGLQERLREAGAMYGFTAWGINEVPEVPTHPVEIPRVAVMHTWQSTQTEGWVRIALDSEGIPYEYISVHDVRDIVDLMSRWDVIIFGPSSSNAFSILDGRAMTGDGPIPWKKSDLTPNIGAQDETDDIRGGLGFEGVIHLRDFIEKGGVFITLTSSSSLPIQFGLARNVSIRDSGDLWARGGVYRAEVADRQSPIVYGYDDELGVYFNSSPIFSGGMGGGMRGQYGGDRGAGGTGRETGRGGVNDPDIVQGRSRTMGAAAIEEWQAMQREERESESGRSERSVPRTATTRTVMRFTRNADDLLISGGLANGEVMLGAPVVVDASLGEGHVVLFSFNPMWRGATHGSYFLVFNTLLHWNDLDAGGGD